jgi:cation transporter-like permease
LSPIATLNQLTGKLFVVAVPWRAFSFLVALKQSTRAASSVARISTKFHLKTIHRCKRFHRIFLNSGIVRVSISKRVLQIYSKSFSECYFFEEVLFEVDSELRVIEKKTF